MTTNSGDEGMAWIKGVALGVALAALLVGAYLIGNERGEDRSKSKQAEQSIADETAPRIKVAPKSEKQEGASKPKVVPDGPGKTLFSERCGGCHVLAAAGSAGTTGPDLDTLKPDAERVLNAIKNGGVTGGAMPKNLATGQDAQAIAEFVSTVTGS